MNDFFTLTINGYGVSIASEPLSIYVSWVTLTVLALAVSARYLVRAYRARKVRQTLTAPAPAAPEADDGYAW